MYINALEVAVRYTFLSEFRNRFNMSSLRRVSIKVTILGDYRVGKTALIEQYVNRTFGIRDKSRRGDFLCKELVIDDKLVSLQMFDTFGQERFRSLGVSFYRGSSCCVLVFDVSNRESFRKLDSWREEMLTETTISEVENFPFLVVGNKVDVGNRTVSTEEAEAWCQNNGGFPYFETSAKDGTNVEEFFLAAARSALACGANVEVVDCVRLSNEENSQWTCGC